MEFLVFHLVPVASCPLTGHHYEKLDSVFLAPSHQVFIHLGKTSTEPSPGLTGPALSASTRDRRANPLII